MKHKTISQQAWQHPDEHDDDRPVGRVLSRREVLALLGTTGAALFLGGCTSAGPGSGIPDGPGVVATDLKALATVNSNLLGTCVVYPEMTEGPYFVDEGLNRADIRSDPTDGAIKEGVLLTLAFNISQVDVQTCIPLEGAIIDIWQCDALGVYSDVSDASFNTVGQKFLRGNQVTNNLGFAQFTTIYPGWYSGRTVHIHIKIRTQTAEGTAYEFTSQLYFDDALSDKIHAQAPYNTKGGTRDTTNNTDMHYANGGDQLLLTAVEASEGYIAAFNFTLDLSNSETGAPDSF